MPVQETSMPVPSQTVPFIDRYRRVTPQWFPWLKRMIDSLRQTVLTVNTIETQVGTIDVTVDQLTTDLNSAELTIAMLQDTTVAQGISITETITLANGINTDLDALESSTSAAISGLDADIGAVSARWGVTISGGNQVIGLVRLDGGASGSAFTVVADKFIVAHPTSSGTVIQAFIIGNVAGTETVGINGNLVVDDTILARHLSVSTLSAISADVGTVTAGLIRNSADTVRFDLPNMRLYRVDGKADFDLLNRRIYMESG